MLGVISYGITMVGWLLEDYEGLVPNSHSTSVHSYAMLSAFSSSFIKMKVGGAEYVRKKSLGAINAVAGFAKALQPYEKPKLKFKRMRKY
jgi:hypothetical protein